MADNKEISKDSVNDLLKLALLEVSEEEKKKLTAQLSDILTYFKKLDDLNTEGIEPTTHALDIKNVVRKDVPGKSLSNEEALKNSKHVKEGYFKAPRILKE